MLHWLRNYTIVEGLKAADGSLKKDINCFINSYLSDKSLGKRMSPEDNINCPLRDLQLIRKIDHKTYKVNGLDRSLLHPLLVFYVIKKWQEEQGKTLNVNISSILVEENSAGNIFCMTLNDLIYYLEKLQDQKYVTVTRTAGLDAVDLKDTNSDEVLEEYYKQVSNI